jgi:hypothetical protein
MKRNLILLLALALLSAAELSCPGGDRKAMEGRCGSSLSRNGEIDNPDLVFRFEKYEKQGARVRDLFNYIYFKGDMICFSFSLPGPVERERIAVRFINPADGMAYPAERCETQGNRVFGFSLAGSLLERFYRQRLEQPVPAGAFCCEDIPFVIELIVREGNRDVSLKNRHTLRIEYR